MPARNRRSASCPGFHTLWYGNAGNEHVDVPTGALDPDFDGNGGDLLQRVAGLAADSDVDRVVADSSRMPPVPLTVQQSRPVWSGVSSILQANQHFFGSGTAAHQSATY